MSLKAVMGVCAFALAGAAFATMSEPGFVYVQPERSSFWHTPASSTVTVPVSYPDGATSATLAVRGAGYSRDYANVAAGDFTLTLPAATDESNENVYELTLTFSGNASVTNTARLAVIAGLRSGAAGSARCLVGTETRRWARAFPTSVLPIPYGTTLLTLGGVAVDEGDAGFTGAQGWYALPGLANGTSVDLSLTMEEAAYDAALTVRDGCGLVVVVQ